MRTPLGRHAWPILFVAMIGPLLAVLFFTSRKNADPPARYTVSRVSRGDIVQAVRTTGQLSPWSSVEVSSQISGLVTEVAVDFNSRVIRGQVLARIDPSTYEQRLRQAHADFDAALANQRLTKLREARLRALRNQDLVSQQEYDDADALLRQSDANLLTRRAAVENARVDLERCTVAAPIDGIVIFKQVEVGKTVVASFSAPTLFVIAQDLSKMQVIAPLNEVDIGSVMVGQPVAFTVDAVPDRTFEGQLAQVRSPYVLSDKQPQLAGPQSAIPSFDAVVEVDNKDLLLRPSLTANVAIITDRRQGVLLIPNSALRVTLPADIASTIPVNSRAVELNGTETYATVYRLRNGDRNGVPEPVMVRLGISDRVSTEVLSGLQPGDEVITGIPVVQDYRPPSAP